MGNPGPAYNLQRSNIANEGMSHTHTDSMDYSEVMEEPSSNIFHDATKRVHEMHLALLYLLSNPEEFQRAIQLSPTSSSGIADWNAEYEDETNSEANQSQQTPLPFIVFASDAEVVLPQAHTASQLFGLERVEGIELEAAAGVTALSQLFLRWLALMPGGDHMNIIDPPGLTVMRIAGGRYRVTAAHRVVWTWMNDFAEDAYPAVPDVDGGFQEEETPHLQMGDLVTMTVVDVFETDNQGKLLSYCPTFDNRAIKKTNPASERIRKSSSKFLSGVSAVANSTAAARVNKAAALLSRMGFQAAKRVTNNVVSRQETKRKQQQQQQVKDAKGFENALNEAAAGINQSSPKNAAAKPESLPPLRNATVTPTNQDTPARGEHYFSDDEETEEGAPPTPSTATR